MRIVLLDCSYTLLERLKSQGFDVESGTVGFSTGVKLLPSQVYEKNILIYNPAYLTKLDDKYVAGTDIKDYSPEYNFEPLRDHVLSGATLLIFVNPVSAELKAQNAAYSWIPFMPALSPTKDKVVYSNSFQNYPDSDCQYLAPVVAVGELDIPVLQKIETPPPQEYPRDIFSLFWNAHRERLGVLMMRGDGRLIILPKFRSNDEMIETFLHRVVPKIYDVGARIGLVDKYNTPAEQRAQREIDRIEALIAESKELSARARMDLATAKREKGNTITKGATSKQILSYYDTALKQDDVALFYLYKIIESIENKYGGEAGGIKSLGFAAEWKFVKKAANVSYGDMRHAPKPGDIITKWSNADIKTCFEGTEKIIFAYFASLFSPAAVRPANAAQK